MTMQEVSQKFTREWGCQAVVVLYRLSGNRSAYAVTDHNGHWLALKHTHTRDGLLFWI